VAAFSNQAKISAFPKINTNKRVSKYRSKFIVQLSGRPHETSGHKQQKYSHGSLLLVNKAVFKNINC